MEFPSSDDKQSKSKVFCCVHGCNSKASRTSGIAFHHFPQANSRRVAITNKSGQTEMIDLKKSLGEKIENGKAGLNLYESVLSSFHI